MDVLDDMLNESRVTAPSVAAPAPLDPLDTMLGESRQALAADPEQDANEVNGLADQLNLPRATIERYIMELRPEKEWFETRSASPDEGAKPQTGPGLIEQIGRMDAIQWEKRVPFSGAAALETAHLLAATKRLQADSYERESEQLLGIAAKQRAIPPEEMKRRPEAAGASVSALRARDIRTVEEFLLRRQREVELSQTFGGAVFQGASYMPAWMIEFAWSGGLAKLGSETAQEIGLRTLQGYATTTAGRAILKTAGWTGGAISRTTLGMPQLIAEEILARRIPALTVGPEGELTIGLSPESWATSIAKGWGAAVIESASETSGGALTAGGKWLTEKTLAKLPFGQAFYAGLRRAYLALHPEDGAAAAFAQKFFSRTAYDGLLGEIGEERVASLLHRLAATRQFSDKPDATYLENLTAGITHDIDLVRTGRQLLVEATVLSLPGAVGLAAQRAAKIRSARTTEGTENTEKGGPHEAVVQEAQGQGRPGPVTEIGLVGATHASPVPAQAGGAAAGTAGPAQPGGSTPAAPEIWQMTRTDYMDWAGQRVSGQSVRKTRSLAKSAHAVIVRQAVREGSPVPPKVLADYPDLVQQVWEPAKAPAAPEREGVWDTAVKAAEAEATLQAQERFVGASEFTFQEYAAALAGAREEDVGKLARQLGTKVPGATGENLRKWVGDALATLTKEEEPPPALAGEAHPGSLTFPGFFARYGAVVENPETPANKAWRERYGRAEGPQGPRKLYKDLVHEWHRLNAWRAFYELTGQQRPAAAGESEIADLSEEAAPFGVFSEAEEREQIAEEETREVQATVREFAGEPAPVDLPDVEREPTALDLSLMRRILRYAGIPDPQGGFEWRSTEDLRRLYSAFQLPNDRARDFPEYAPLRDIQVARQRYTRSLGGALIERAQPFLDLSDADFNTVMEVAAAIDQQAAYKDVYEQEALSRFTPAQAAGYKAHRKTLDDIGKLMVQRMRELGVREEWIKEFEARIGNYITHAWYGDWIIIVKERRTKGEMQAERRQPETLYKWQGSRWEATKEYDRLKAEYPDAEVWAPFEDKDMPAEAYQESTLSAVSAMMDKVFDLAKAKGGVITPELEAVLNQAKNDWWKAKGAGAHWIQRQNVPGYVTDRRYRRAFVDYVMGTAGSLAKMEAALKFPEALAGIDASRTPKLFARATEDVRYWLGDDTDWQRLSRVIHFMYLWDKPAAAVANLTQNLVLGWPVLSKHTRWSLAKLLDAMADTAAGPAAAEGSALTKGVRGLETGEVPQHGLQANEVAYLKKKRTEGFLEAQMSQEIAMRPGNPGTRAIMGAGQKIYSALNFMEQAERFNRESMYVALLRAGIADPAAEAGADPADAIVNEAHFEYGKGNRPPIARNLLKPPTFFRTWVLNYLTWQKNQVQDREAGALARSKVAMWMLAGLGGSPIWGPLLYVLWPRIFGTNPEEEAEKAIGETLTKVVFRGVPSLIGISMRSSVGMGDLIPLPEPGQEWDAALGQWIGGAPLGLYEQSKRVLDDLDHGLYRRALEDASPAALRNPLAALRLYREGATARNGRIVWDFDGMQQMKLTEWEAIAKGLGFTPDRMLREYDRGLMAKMLSTSDVKRKQAWADRYYLAAKSKDLEGMAEVTQEIADYNAKMQARGQGDQKIDVRSFLRMIETRAMPVNWPSRKEVPETRRIWGKEPAAPAK